MAEITFQQDGGSVRRQCGRVSAIHGLRSPRSQSNKCSTDLGRDCSNSTNQCSTDREKSLGMNKDKDKMAETLIGNAFHCISSLQIK